MKNPEVLIGLVGFPNSGKDYLSTVLCEDYGFCRYALGDRVKDVLMATDPLYRGNIQHLEWMKRNDLGHTREKLQRLGQSIRDINPYFWIKSLPSHLWKFSVITDIRYSNELTYLKERGGISVFLEREGSGEVNDHESEKSTRELASKVDLRLDNNRPIHEVAAELVEYLENAGLALE